MSRSRGMLDSKMNSSVNITFSRFVKFTQGYFFKLSQRRGLIEVNKVVLKTVVEFPEIQLNRPVDSYL